MKRLLSATLLLINFFIFAQEKNKKELFLIPKKSWVIESSISISNTSGTQNEVYQNGNNFNLSLSPNVGYAINNNLIAGLGINYRHSNSQNIYGNISRSESNSYGIFAYIKKHIPISKRLSFHLSNQIGFGKSKYNDYMSYLTDYLDFGTNINESNVFYVQINPGLSFSVTKNILLNANFGSLAYSYITSNSNKAHNFNFNLNPSDISFGLSLIL